MTALAATAGVAIENARLFEESRRRQEWLQASAEVTRMLLTAPGDDALRGIAPRVSELAAADLVTVVLPADQDTSSCRTSPRAGRRAAGGPPLPDGRRT